MTRVLIPALSLLAFAVACEGYNDVSVEAALSLSDAARAAVTEPSLVVARFVVETASGEPVDLGYQVLEALCDDDDALSAEPYPIQAAWGPCQQADVSLEAFVVPIDGDVCEPQAGWTPPTEPGASVFLVALDGSCGAWTDEVALVIE